MKRDQNKPTRKLSLNKETIRELQLRETSVNGAATGVACPPPLPVSRFGCFPTHGDPCC